MLTISVHSIDDIVRLIIPVSLLSQSCVNMDSFPNMQKAQRTKNNYINKPQGQVSSILKRSLSDPLDIPTRISLESMTFGSVPFKRLNDFEHGHMPEENPKLQRQSGWMCRCNGGFESVC